jgi:hypothetical protein
LDCSDLVGSAGTASLLSTVLHDSAVLPSGINALSPFEKVVAQWLFHINIFFSLAGPDGEQRMPVIGSGNGNRIEVFVLERLANVPGSTWARPTPLVFDLVTRRAPQAGIWINQVRDLTSVSPSN